MKGHETGGWSWETVAIWPLLQSSRSQVAPVNLSPGRTVYRRRIQHVHLSRWIVGLNSFSSHATRQRVNSGCLFALMSRGKKENRGDRYFRRTPAKPSECLFERVSEAANTWHWYECRVSQPQAIDCEHFGVLQWVTFPHFVCKLTHVTGDEWAFRN